MKCNEYETKSGKPIRLWQGDCMELMEQDKQWDLAICDPPYGINAGNMTMGKGSGNDLGTNKLGDWDKNIPDSDYFTNLKNISNNQIIWGGNYFLQYLGKSRGPIIWNKLDYNSDFADGEMAWSSCDKNLKIIDRSRAANGEHLNKIHSTQKPVYLYRWLLQNYAEENDTILDTHGGSMSLAIACYIEDFELDIIELDEDYYNDAVERFENHISQKTLF